MDWFLYDNGLPHERVNEYVKMLYKQYNQNVQNGTYLLIANGKVKNNINNLEKSFSQCQLKQRDFVLKCFVD